MTQYLSAGLVLLEMMKTSEIYRFEPKNMNPSFTVLARILSVGLPSGLQSMVFSLSNIIIQSAEILTAFKFPKISHWCITMMALC